MGHGSPQQVAEDMRKYREEAGLEEFQINFNGCNNLDQLLASMELFMREVRPLVEQ
jgi:alkanesulfonate monooxygenase SsuD/methylene tetrahydromethanopterin reductase-like flavin-dependent oxidoreductase (luciferase family)